MLARLSLVALVLGSSAVNAQSSSSSSSSSASATSSASSSSSTASSSIIPSGLSAGCSTFLGALNSDATLSACVTPLLTLTNAAAVSSNTSALASSLDSLCAASGCSNAFVRGRLTDFYGNCSAELADGDSSVRSLYDILYTVVPLKEVVCTKDETSSDYCVVALSANVTTSASNDTLSTSANGTASTNSTSSVLLASTHNHAVVGSSSSPAAFAGQHLSTASLASTAGGLAAKRALTTGSDGTYPNATTYRSTNLPYLFIQPSDGASILCSSCAQAVFSAYAQWETQTTYALGLSESPILGGQAALWSAAQTTCGTTWIEGIVSAATASGSSADEGSSTSALSAADRSATASTALVAGVLGALLALVL